MRSIDIYVSTSVFITEIIMRSFSRILNQIILRDSSIIHTHYSWLQGCDEYCTLISAVP